MAMVLSLWLGLYLLASTAADLTKHIHDGSFTPDEVLRVTRRNMGIGGIFRYTTLVNDTVPGPTLRLPEEKILWIRVYNDMTDANLTMHWHGLSQAAAPFSDGSPMASQWPIPPQHYFDYEVRVDNGSAGTYFYHSHVDFQTSTASGPLIIEDPPGQTPYPTDGERTIHIQELFRRDDDDILTGLQATPMRWSGETAGFLLNGDTIADSHIEDAASARLTVIAVEPSKTYRLRFIGASVLSYASLAIDKHADLFIIEADGSYTQPHLTPLLQIGPGQRFSALLHTKSCAELRRLRRLDFHLQIESRERPTTVRNYAILRYDRSCALKGDSSSSYGSRPWRLPTTSYPKRAPLALPPTIHGFLDYALRPLVPNNGFPAAADVTRRIYIHAQLVANRWLVWRDNGVSWAENPGRLRSQHATPREPYLVSLYRNATAYLPHYEAALANGGLDGATSTYPARLGEVLEIVIQHYGAVAMDGSGWKGVLETHPWHAHGEHYWDIGGGEGRFDPRVAEPRLAGTQPVLRDTTMLFRYNDTARPGQPSGWRAWRLRVGSPGVWMIHCHTAQHMIGGMQTVWVFGDRDDLLTVARPVVGEYLRYGGNVNGNATHPPEVLHFNEISG